MEFSKKYISIFFPYIDCESELNVSYRIRFLDDCVYRKDYTSFKLINIRLNREILYDNVKLFSVIKRRDNIKIINFDNQITYDQQACLDELESTFNTRPIIYTTKIGDTYLYINEEVFKNRFNTGLSHKKLQKFWKLVLIDDDDHISDLYLFKLHDKPEPKVIINSWVDTDKHFFKEMFKQCHIRKDDYIYIEIDD